jgi:hypothetical protein
LARDEAFRQGLQELGYVEGRNIVIAYRYAEGRFDRLPELAAELVNLKVDVIVAVVTQASLAQECYRDDSDRHGRRCRSCRGRTCCEPSAAWRKHYRHFRHDHGGGGAIYGIKEFAAAGGLMA